MKNGVFQTPPQLEAEILEIFSNLQCLPIRVRLSGGKPLFDLSHLDNIYDLKPALVFSIYHNLRQTSFYGETCMDNVISNHYEDAEDKWCRGLEDIRAQLEAIDVAYTKLSDIDGELCEGNNSDSQDNVSMIQSLEAIHDCRVSEDDKSLMGRRAMDRRNNNCLNKHLLKYMKEGAVEEDALAAVGAAHFSGKEGLIWKTQEGHDWRWYVKNLETGTYERFYYDPIFAPDNPIQYKSDRNLKNLGN